MKPVALVHTHDNELFPRRCQRKKNKQITTEIRNINEVVLPATVLDASVRCSAACKAARWQPSPSRHGAFKCFQDSAVACPSSHTAMGMMPWPRSAWAGARHRVCLYLRRLLSRCTVAVMQRRPTRSG